MRVRGVIIVSKSISGSIVVPFLYIPQLVEKLKTVEGQKCHHPFLLFSTTRRTRSPQSRSLSRQSNLRKEEQ